jgi:Icc-related predicted phosphoesterase
MRVHVVSDVHGNAEGLARAGEGADALIVLGDLVDLVDYQDHSAGIFGRVFGAEVVGRFAALRRDGRPGEFHAFARTLWDRFERRPGTLEEAVREQYDTLFTAMSAATTSLGTYAIPGNVDLPHLWPEFGRDGVHLADGRVVSIGGVRVGFVGGVPLPDGVPVLRRGPWRPYLRSASEYADAVAGLSGAEVLCSHAPPAVPELAYDVIARRFEGPSPALAGFIHANAPRAALFGHVHHPLCGRARVGRTECVNVGYFRRTGVPHVLRL